MFASLPPLRNVIDSQHATVEILSVDLGNSLVAPILHLHKTVALRATGVPVRPGIKPSTFGDCTESEIPAFPRNGRDLTGEISTSVVRRRPASPQLFLRPEFRRRGLPS